MTPSRYIDRGLNFLACAPPARVQSAVEIARERLQERMNGNGRVVSETIRARATAVWDRLLGLFGDALLRKFGAEHPQEWETGVGYLTDAQIERGFRRLVFGWKGGPPSLPDFVRVCRSIGDDTVEEGPQPRHIPLPAADDAKFDGWAITSNNRFFKYIGHRLTSEPRAWGPPAVHANRPLPPMCIAVAYKNAWAQDMRDADTVDTQSGEVVRLSQAEQDRAWVDCMKRAETDIAVLMCGGKRHGSGSLPQRLNARNG